jgi:excisionase family DNA binding protein
METPLAYSIGLEPLAVSPRQACLLLGIGNTRLYQLIGNRELVAYKDGRARRITLASIRDRVARLTGADIDGDAPQPRRRGRPRKHTDATVTP